MAAEPTADEIFQKVFKRPPPPLAEARYPLIIEGDNLGDALISRPDNPAETTIERAPLLRALGLVLRQDLLEKLAAGEQTRPVRLGELRAIGLDANFDRTSLSLAIRVPLELQTRRAIAATPGRGTPSLAGAIRPASFSGWLNVVATQTHVQDTDDQSQRGRNPLGAFFTGSFRLTDWALDYHYTYSEDDSPRWQRGDVTLVRDWPEQAIRAQMGDVAVPGQGFQASPPLAGLSVAREFRLQPYTTFQPVGQRDFDVEESSRVQVYINGAFVREMRLSPGRYNLRNLPVTDGFGNDVELRVINDAGEIRTLRSVAFFDYNLLAPDVAEYGVTGGLPRTFEDGQRDYDRDNPFGSTFFRYGVTDAVTLGGNLQSGAGQTLAGTEALVATAIGSFLISPATSFGDSNGGSGLLQYHAVVPGSNRGLERYFDMSALYQSPGFLAPSLTVEDTNRWSLLSRFSQQLDEDRRIQIGVERDIGGAAADTVGASLSVSQWFGLGSASLGVQARRQDHEHEQGVWLSFSVPLGGGTATATVDSRHSSARALYTHPASPGVGGLGYSVGYARSDSGDNAVGDVTYTGNRFEVSASQQASALATGTGRDVRTTAAIGTALVFADGRLGVSRPVRDSFLMVTSHPAVGDVDLVVDTHRPFGSDQYYAMAESDFLGPAVVPDLNSYFVRELSVEAPGAPPGISIGNDVVKAYPSYHSGSVVELGGVGNVSAVITFQHPDGTPFVNAALRPAEGAATGPFFTNKIGRGFLEGLEPGKTYQFHISEGDKRYLVKVEIPAGQFGIYRAPTPILALPVQ